MTMDRDHDAFYRQAEEAHDAYGPQSGPGWAQGFDDYRAATADMEPGERPPYIADEWRDSYAQPQVPEWADDSPAAPEPVGQCGVQGCACAYGGRCPNARDPYEPGGWY
jgi:hypothetical protein